MADESQQTDDQATKPNVRVEDAGPARKKLSIEIPPDLISARLSENFDRLHEEAVIPGFRPGKAPRRLLEKRFGNDVRSHVRDELVGEAYQHAIEENNLQVLGEPEIPDRDHLELPEDGPLHFEVTVEVSPEFDLPDLSTLSVTKPATEVTDQQIDSEIDQLRNLYGTMEDTEGPVQPGDRLSGALEVRSAEGEVLHQAESAPLAVPSESDDDHDHILEISVEGVRSELTDKRPGDSVRFDVQAPEDHGNEAFAGRSLSIHYRIDRIQRPRALTTAELLERAGLDSEQSLRDHIRQSIEQQEQNQQQKVVQEQLVGQLLDQVDFDVPENILTQQTERSVQQQLQTVEEVQPSEETQESIRSQSKEEIRQQLKRHFILERLADRLGADVSEHEVNRQITQIAMQSGQRPERVRQELAQAGQLDRLYGELRRERALGMALSYVQTTEVSREEWERRNQAQSSGEQGEAADAGGSEAAGGGEGTTDDQGA